MIAEGNETPGGESGGTPEGRGRLNEGDILAERRARRAAESGEHALTLRAEAAEATVRTLETHVASLQQQLRESEEEAHRLSERIDAPRHAQPEGRLQQGEHVYTAPQRDAALERELQRASQREYAEQRLRLDAEERAGEVERETRTEIERLGRRVDASERDALELGARLEAAQRELAEAEQALAAQQVAVQQSERELRERLSGLERQAEQLHGGLEAERAARERAEQMLAALQQAQRGAQLLLSGLADTVARLRETAQRQRVAARPDAQPAVAEAPGAPIVAAPTAPTPPALAAAPGPPAHATPPTRPTPPRSTASGEASGGEMAAALAAAVERLRARVEEQAIAFQPAAPKAPPHKHTMSLIARTRLALRRRREQRKQRRAA